jgi:septal ring factor EnvC (AmiA/AmiB activator)
VTVESVQRRKHKKRPDAPPRKRSTRIEDPNSLTDVINSQLSINSSSTTSSGGSTNRLSFHEDTADSSEQPQLHQKSAYVKQLETKNCQLVQQHSELQNRLAEMEHEVKNPKMSVEASSKIQHLEDTVNQLMQTIYDQQQKRFDQQHSHTSSIMAERGCGDGFPDSHAGFNESVFGPRSGNTSYSESSHSNYLNTAPFLGMEAPHQRHSQSSDSGYCGSVALSPTEGVRRAPELKELRVELGQVVKSLTGVVEQNSRLQEMLMTQMKVVSNVAIQVANMEKSLASLESGASNKNNRAANDQSYVSPTHKV